jgi:hypothetical protein
MMAAPDVQKDDDLMGDHLSSFPNISRHFLLYPR